MLLIHGKKLEPLVAFRPKTVHVNGKHMGGANMMINKYNINIKVNPKLTIESARLTLFSSWTFRWCSPNSSRGFITGLQIISIFNIIKMTKDVLFNGINNELTL